MVVGNTNIAVGKGIECGEGQLDEYDSDKEGEKSGEYRFGQELEDEVPALGADSFADAYFAGPFFRPGGGEIHKIDACDQQDEQADDAEHADVVDKATGDL